MDCTFKICTLQDKDGHEHSALWIPKTLPCNFGCQNALPANDVFNLIMIEDSKDMKVHWPHIVSAWNKNIKDKLEGRTNVYTFGDLVQLKRLEPELMQKDLENNKTSNFTQALRTIRIRVQSSKETNIKIIIIKGPHDAGEPFPEDEIRLIKPHIGRTIVVYILGIGDEFPAQHCFEILSKLNTGNKNDVTFFKAKDTKDIADQCSKIGNILRPYVAKLELSIGGFILPGYPYKTTSVQLGEWIYFEEPQTELSTLALKVNNKEYIDITDEMVQRNAQCDLVFLFLQWNNVLIQEKCKEKMVPREVFDLIKSFYTYFQNECLSSLSKHELKLKKDFRSCENQFRQLMKQMITHTDDKMMNKELKLADLYLKTAAINYDVKATKNKFCNDARFAKTVELFHNLYENVKSRIMTLPHPKLDECCRITKSSTLSQLMEKDFEKVLQKNKFDFLRSFIMSGIPVFSLMNCAVQRNPWAFKIKHILVEPYSVMSQQALEDFAEFREDCLDCNTRAVQVETGMKKTKFNAVIPIIPAYAASVLKPLVQSDLYAMAATYCIHKNPTAIEYAAHFAALGCAWLKTLEEYPDEERPEFIRNRLDDIVGTAKLYLDKCKVANYLNALMAEPKQALMFESTLKFKNKSVRCESLLKPVFLLFLTRESISKKVMAEIFQLIVFEFIRRCIIKKARSPLDRAPFIQYFCSQLSSPDHRREWLENHSKVIIDRQKEKYENLLERFYTLKDLRCSVRKDIVSGLEAKGKRLFDDLTIDICMEKVTLLRNPNTCGEITWSTLEVLSRELGLPTNLPNKNEALLFVAAILNKKEAKKQLPDVPSSQDKVLSLAREKILREILVELRKVSSRDWSLAKNIEEEWKEEFKKRHRSLAIPMTPQQIVAEAQGRGVAVRQETFHDVYKYDDYTQLLRNACQIRECPHYLVPHKNFNLHLSQSKISGHHVESFHWIIRKYGHHGMERVKQELHSKELALLKERRRSQRTSEPFKLTEDVFKKLVANVYN
ncbi:uncharacterized protein LOC135221141 [Macrobrachium nipponense]|uniref:uncharacterized protein LOC135221141 n=1 Tax=Macrobrachium nipponense TaxID=159736 RepID=UPI0030C7DE15